MDDRECVSRYPAAVARPPLLPVPMVSDRSAFARQAGYKQPPSRGGLSQRERRVMTRETQNGGSSMLVKRRIETRDSKGQLRKPAPDGKRRQEGAAAKQKAKKKRWSDVQLPPDACRKINSAAQPPSASEERLCCAAGYGVSRAWRLSPAGAWLKVLRCLGRGFVFGPAAAGRLCWRLG